MPPLWDNWDRERAAANDIAPALFGWWCAELGRGRGEAITAEAALS